MFSEIIVCIYALHTCARYRRLARDIFSDLSRNLHPAAQLDIETIDGDDLIDDITDGISMPEVVQTIYKNLIGLSGSSEKSGVADALSHGLEVAYHFKRFYRYAYKTDEVPGRYVLACILHAVEPSSYQQVFDSIEVAGGGLADFSGLVRRLEHAGSLPYALMPGAVFGALNYMNMMLQVAETPEVLLAVFADKLVMVKDSGIESGEKVRAELQEVYMPFAERCGLTLIASELADSWFGITYPEVYREKKQELEEVLGMIYQEAQEFAYVLERKVKEKLDELQVKYVEVSARAKSVYSAYRKVKEKREYPSLDSLRDLIGIRVIVDSEEDYALAMGVPYFFIDEVIREQVEIKRREDKGYEAFHSGGWVEGATKSVAVEFQVFPTVRDFFHYHIGVAAHWSYKAERASEQRSKNLRYPPDKIKLSGYFRDDFYRLLDSVRGYSYLFSLKRDRNRRVNYLRIIRVPKDAVLADAASMYGEGWFDLHLASVFVYEGARYDYLTGEFSFAKKMEKSWLASVHTGQAIEEGRFNQFLSSMKGGEVRRHCKLPRTKLLIDLQEEGIRDTEELEGKAGKAVLEANLGISISPNTESANRFFNDLMREYFGLYSMRELYLAIERNLVSVQFIRDVILANARRRLLEREPELPVSVEQIEETDLIRIGSEIMDVGVWLKEQKDKGSRSDLTSKSGGHTLYEAEPCHIDELTSLLSSAVTGLGSLEGEFQKAESLLLTCWLGRDTRVQFAARKLSGLMNEVRAGIPDHPVAKPALSHVYIDRLVDISDELRILAEVPFETEDVYLLLGEAQLLISKLYNLLFLDSRILQYEFSAGIFYVLMQKKIPLEVDGITIEIISQIAETYGPTTFLARVLDDSSLFLIRGGLTAE
ncbi:MAG: hypothetical protein GF375_05960, partial [Candidatus Omnitrophica bacterium]|nr:hypothetical protein [Candidatus Omnitrophota bacterium]MBD3269520.1 hypothetical protein [Candidatus Omnitrophota bacterium]